MGALIIGTSLGSADDFMEPDKSFCPDIAAPKVNLYLPCMRNDTDRGMDDAHVVWRIIPGIQPEQKSLIRELVAFIMETCLVKDCTYKRKTGICHDAADDLATSITFMGNLLRWKYL